MIDKEIIKALECCEASEGIHPNCTECPYFSLAEKPSNCYIMARKQALDLINRQQAEIESLQRKVNRLKRYDEERDIALHSKLIATARTEAIKEFAYELKIKIGFTQFIKNAWLIEIIDNLVEKMVGDVL